MDVSIKSIDKQAREAFIKAREEKQTAKDLRAQKRKDREDSRNNTVIERRLRRRIKIEVRDNLLMEKQNYLKGEATGNQYLIYTVIEYKGHSWRCERVFVEKILEEVLAKHSGFDYKVDFQTDRGVDEWCNSIRIWYTLLEQ